MTPAQRFKELNLVKSGAILDGPDDMYRYVLSRSTGLNFNFRLLWVMVNPSVATASTNDHTIMKCLGFSQRMCAGEFRVINLCAYRSQDVSVLKSSEFDLVGPDNDAYTEIAAKWADVIVCAWGSRKKLPPHLRARPDTVYHLLREAAPHRTIGAIGLTQDGDPLHPLMPSYNNKLIEFTG